MTGVMRFPAALVFDFDGLILDTEAAEYTSIAAGSPSTAHHWARTGAGNRQGQLRWVLAGLAGSGSGQKGQQRPAVDREDAANAKPAPDLYFVALDLRSQQVSSHL